MRGDGTTRAERIIRSDEPIASIALLTLVDGDGREWIAGASLTRARPKGDGDEASIQLTEDTAQDWRIKEFRIIEP